MGRYQGGTETTERDEVVMKAMCDDFLCRYTETPSSKRNEHAEGYCWWQDKNGNSWHVTVDKNGIAWTWCST